MPNKPQIPPNKTQRSFFPLQTYSRKTFGTSVCVLWEKCEFGHQKALTELTVITNI